MRLYNRLLVWLDTILLVMVIQKHQILSITIIPNNFCDYNFALKSLPGVVPDKAFSWLLEWLDTIQMVMVVQKQ